MSQGVDIRCIRPIHRPSTSSFRNVHNTDRGTRLMDSLGGNSTVNDWFLEHDNDGDIYTLPSANREAIERVIDMFDGQHTFYCCLSNADESCLWCVGEPERRLIEGRVIEGESVSHFILRRRGEFSPLLDKFRHGINPEDVVKVTSSEVLTPSEVLSVFMAFHDKREIPSDYELVTGVRLFGPNSFGE